MERRAQAIETLVSAGAGYWYAPYGEPEWVKISPSKFWMGEGDELHQVELPEYHISRVPVTNAQYSFFVKATERQSPEHWQDGRVPKGLESHPVVNVTWYDAIEYCKWLSKATGKQITLPSEAEWEKAARGDKDKRKYPWGDEFDSSKCNTRELGIGGTTPVGIFLEGTSPCGVLDMSGNVWEWTRTNYETGKDDLVSNGSRVLRGGSFNNESDYARCAIRYGNHPYYWGRIYGFRVVVVSPALLS
jgi:formylglycine-generating enzyme required for sulfatase activity